MLVRCPKSKNKIKICFDAIPQAVSSICFHTLCVDERCGDKENPINSSFFFNYKPGKHIARTTRRLPSVIKKSSIKSVNCRWHSTKGLQKIFVAIQYQVSEFRLITRVIWRASESKSKFNSFSVSYVNCNFFLSWNYSTKSCDYQKTWPVIEVKLWAQSGDQ